MAFGKIFGILFLCLYVLVHRDLPEGRSESDDVTCPFLCCKDVQVLKVEQLHTD